jgi:hypothetical protein
VGIEMLNIKIKTVLHPACLSFADSDESGQWEPEKLGIRGPQGMKGTNIFEVTIFEDSM